MLVNIHELSGTGVDFIMKSLAGRERWERVDHTQLLVRSKTRGRDFWKVRSPISRYSALEQWTRQTRWCSSGYLQDHYADTTAGCLAAIERFLPNCFDVPDNFAEYLITDDVFGCGEYNIDFVTDNEHVYLQLETFAAI